MAVSDCSVAYAWLKGIFRLHGCNVIAYPVDYYSKTANGLCLDAKYWMHVRDFNFTLKEWIGLFVYYYSGKTAALFPGPDELGVMPE